MTNGQPNSQGHLLLENTLPTIPEDETMVQEASSIADMLKSPEMKFFRKFPSKNVPEEVITIEDSDDDPIVIKDSDDENEKDVDGDEARTDLKSKGTKNPTSVTQDKGVDTVVCRPFRQKRKSGLRD